jgi:GT2 family glycosyltransferase
MSSGTLSRVSVAVPVRNEERTLGALLDALLQQTRPPDEIVVADAGSLDGSVAVARNYADRGVRVLEIGPAFPGRARNRAIEAATHDWVGLIDAGCVPRPNWLEELLRSRDATGARVVYGNYEPRLRSEWDVAQTLGLVAPVDPKTACRPPFIASALLHREAWRAADGFPEALRAAEDLLFFERVAAAGVQVARSPAALISWNLAAGPRGVWRRLRLYSAYHAAAGLHGTWHRRVMAMDLAAVLLASAAVLWPPAGLVLAAGGLARVLRTVAQRAGDARISGRFRPDRLARVAWLLAVADAAMWAGLLDSRTRDLPSS